jgi:hypothetical protein
MEDITNTKDLDIFPSVFSDLEDSSYGSDKLSIVSAITTLTVSSNVSTEVPAAGAIIPTALKSILKKPGIDTKATDLTSESSYESDYSDSEIEEPLELSALPCQAFEEEFSGKLPMFKLNKST